MLHLPMLGEGPRERPSRAARLDVRGLEAALRARVGGEVRFDEQARAMYATDASNYRQVPIGVVSPRDAGDVEAILACARAFGAPVLSRGGGTSLAGQCCNVALVIDWPRHMNRVLEVDPERRVVRVEPGCTMDAMRKAAEEHGLTFGPDPATHTHNAVGGMLGNDSCGVHSLLHRKHGLGLRTSDATESLEVLTYDGTRMRLGALSDEEARRAAAAPGRAGAIVRELAELRDRHERAIRGMPQLPRRVSGFHLDALLPENGVQLARAVVGTEGTCVAILEATMRIVPAPKVRRLLVLGYPDLLHAGEDVMALLAFEPIALEGLDRELVDLLRAKGTSSAEIADLPPGDAWLLCELGGETDAEVRDQAARLAREIRGRTRGPSLREVDHEQAVHIWKVRQGGLGATAWVPGKRDTWEGWEDSAVPPERVGEYLRDFRALLDRHGMHPALYGHFGQGCVHTRIPFDLYTRDGVDRYRAFVEEAADLVVSYGGSLSGEHGDGQSRGELLPKMYGEEIVGAFGAFKRIWDPDGKMNPGKVVDPAPLDAHLRLGPHYAPPHVETHFGFAADKGSFARAALRCVGIGECRRPSGSTMCPSFRATREEQHSTRGRAHLLFEMMRGEVVKGGFRSEAVKDALDLCLACKGCKSDCPVNVDMATYKAEFLAHYYEGRPRPRSAWAFGFVHVWLRFAARVPGLAWLATQLPGARAVLRAAAGVDPRRRIPAPAGGTFRAWFRARPAPRRAGRLVVLWPDTFHDHFHPDSAKAAVEVLESAGFRVAIPARDLCCGRPLYDYGFVDVAKRWLGRTLDELRPAIRAGVPVVALEPSCFSVFRDELPNLYPDDQDAKRLAAQTFSLASFLQTEAKDAKLPALRRKVVVHGHCHQKSVEGMAPLVDVLRRVGADVEAPDTGCCGMAGAFGFEAGRHHDVSIQCGELALMPAVRGAAADTILCADGFSCREQIAQGSQREAMHLADVLRLGLVHGPDGPDRGAPPERAGIERRRAEQRRAVRRAALGVALAGLGIAGWRALRRLA